MISGAPISSTTISAGLAIGAGGQTLTPTGPAVFTWVAPNATLQLSGGPQTLIPTGPAVFTWVAPNQTLDPGNVNLTPTGPAVFTWVAPDRTLVQGGTSLATSAMATWVAPNTSLNATGTVTLVPTGPAVFTWVVPNRHLRRSVEPSGGGSQWAGLPFNKFRAVVLSDTVNLPEMSLALYVGEGGDVAVVEQDGSVRLFVGVPTGSILAVKAKRVNETDTSAASIVALNRD